MKYGRNVHKLKYASIYVWSPIFDLTSLFQYGGHNVISRNKVLLPGE